MNVLVQLRSGIQAVFEELLSQPRHLLVLRLTLLLLLFYGSSTVFLDLTLRVVCSLMLLSSTLTVSPVAWTIVCGLVWWTNALHWLWIDNHQFLISYWCLACALATASRSIDSVLAWNGQILIGLTFLFATIWKVIGGEYWDGSFFLYTLLTDSRIASLTSFVGGVTPDVLPQNRWLESALQFYPDVDTSVTLGSNFRIELFARVASYWTILIEGSIAALFLMKANDWFVRVRDILLMVFLVTTYFVLPVLGFAYILIIMALAQCSIDRPKTRIVYLSILGLLQFARIL